MLKAHIESELRSALKDGDALKLSVLRMLSSAIHNREIEKRTKLGGGAPIELEESEVLEVIRAELKKRRDAKAAYTAGSRPEAAAQEQSEAEMLSGLLPPELDDGQLEALIIEGQAALGVDKAKDFGRLMGWVMARVKGQASGERVQSVVRRFLGGP